MGSAFGLEWQSSTAYGHHRARSALCASRRKQLPGEIRLNQNGLIKHLVYMHPIVGQV